MSDRGRVRGNSSRNKASAGDQSHVRKLTTIEYADAESNPVPEQRSGHRIFVDSDYMYVIGGYTGVAPEGVILREMWQLNLITHRWTKLEIPSSFPTHLASFSSCSNGFGEFLVYGGTDIPFGQHLDSHVYFGHVKDNQVHINRFTPQGNRPGSYGHVMVWDDEKKVYYTIGGTDGQEFRLDVYTLRKSGNGSIQTWNWAPVLSRYENGVYRMEATLDKGLIYLFGGGTPSMVNNFESLLVFDTKKGDFDTVFPSPDPEHGYPAGRRCHGLARWGRIVVITGGSSEDIRQGEGHQVRMFGDVWSFNLDSHEWKFICEMATPVFFHDSTVTKEGQLLVFGGVIDSRSQSRTNDTQSIWLDPPSLFTSALSKVSKRVPLREEFKMGDKDNLTRVLYNDIVTNAA